MADWLRYELDLSRDIAQMIEIILFVIIGLIIVSIIIRVIKSRSGKNISDKKKSHGFMSMRGRTTEQKQVIKYFNSKGLLAALFGISDATFDKILKQKTKECKSWIGPRSLKFHGTDADEVSEVRPILMENYADDSALFKMSTDGKFRASGYQISLVLFSDKQVFLYSYTFDLTSADTTEKSSEYFYEDITNIEVIQKEIEFSKPRPFVYLVGGILCLFFSFLMFVAVGQAVGFIFGLAGAIAAVVIMNFLNFNRSVTKSLSFKLTVAGDEYGCAMGPEGIATVQGMKAKIREKKR